MESIGETLREARRRILQIRENDRLPVAERQVGDARFDRIRRPRIERQVVDAERRGRSQPLATWIELKENRAAAAGCLDGVLVEQRQ